MKGPPLLKVLALALICATCYLVFDNLSTYNKKNNKQKNGSEKNN